MKKEKISKEQIPETARKVTDTLVEKGFEAYLVGGCVRDLLRGKMPKDWDVTTNATPEEIISIFPHTHYENNFGTVGVVFEEEENPTLQIIEVTPFRVESEYSDSRRPDSVEWGQHIEEDLERRDFTINAIAVDMPSLKIVDPFDGLRDIEKRRIKAVRDPRLRFQEDGLRILRAIRLQAELNFTIEHETSQAIAENVSILNKIAQERIRDELIRIVMSPSPAESVLIAQKLGVLKEIIPELEEGLGMEQTATHKYDVFMHLLVALQHTADKGWPLEIRLAALFHDIGKPRTRRKGGKNNYTFYGHEVVGERMSKKILQKLKFPKKTIDKVVTLIRWHMFFSDTEQITLSAVRRMISNVGKENVWDLINLRIADRVAIGRPKEEPYRLRKYQSMIEEVMSDPISVGMLKIDGNNLQKDLQIKPGPIIGHILHILLDEVLEDPKLNETEYLLKKAQELSKLSEKELKKLGERGKNKKEEEEEQKVKKIRGKYGIK